MWAKYFLSYWLIFLHKYYKQTWYWKIKNGDFSQDINDWNNNIFWKYLFKNLNQKNFFIWPNILRISAFLYAIFDDPYAVGWKISINHWNISEKDVVFKTAGRFFWNSSDISDFVKSTQIIKKFEIRQLTLRQIN